MAIQQDISNDKTTKKKVGQTYRVLIDRKEGEILWSYRVRQSWGRQRGAGRCQKKNTSFVLGILPTSRLRKPTITIFMVIRYK